MSSSEKYNLWKWGWGMGAAVASTNRGTILLCIAFTDVPFKCVCLCHKVIKWYGCKIVFTGPHNKVESMWKCLVQWCICLILLAYEKIYICYCFPECWPHLFTLILSSRESVPISCHKYTVYFSWHLKGYRERARLH